MTLLKIVTGFVAASIFPPVNALADGPPSGSEIVARVIGEVSGARFRLDIFETWKRDDAPQQKIGRHAPKHPGWIITRQLRIDCLSGCDHPIALREDTIDTPIGAFRLWDSSNEFITIWGGGSAYHVRVYQFSPSQVRKVLDAGSRSAPQFVNSLPGHTDIVLDDPDAPYRQTRTTVNGVLWSWSGSGYKPR